jgi:hypothetical protein
MTASIVILQLALLGVVFESDLGHRKIGWFRILRPVIAIAIIVPFFFKSLPTGHHDLLLQAAGLATGALLGLLSVSPLLVSVRFEPTWRAGHRWLAARMPARPAAVSHAGLGYAAIWIAVTVFRLGFAYASQHWFPADLGRFLVTNQLSPAALTNAFIFLALGMDLFRSLLLALRGQHARRSATASPALATPATGAAR